MLTLDEKKAELMQDIEKAWGDWDMVAKLAREGLQVDPEWFDAATSLQAACIEIAALKVNNADKGIGSFFNERSQVLSDWEGARGAVVEARKANRLVRELAKKQRR